MIHAGREGQVAAVGVDAGRTARAEPLVIAAAGELQRCPL